MKKLLTILSVFLLAFTLFGCGTTTVEQDSEKDLLTQIKERGYLVVATEGTWSPWTFHDENGELTGYDIEIGKLIADKIGVEVRFEEGKWDDILLGLEAGRYDVMINGVTVTDERKAKYDFSNAYAYDYVAVMTKTDREDINSFEDLNGKVTANTISSVYATIAEGYGATVEGIDDLNQTFELLLAGRVDATLNSVVSYLDYMNAHPDAEIKVVAQSADADEIAIPVSKKVDSTSFLELVNSVISECRADGTLTDLSVKYFGIDIATK